MGLFPPIDFALYGLDASWTGPRWLDFFEGRAGDPSWAVWLGHGEDGDRTPGHPWVIVGSLSRAHMGLAREPFEQHLALSAIGLDPTIERADDPAGMSRRWAEWPTAPWTVDGIAVTARIRRCADQWMGFARHAPGSGVVVHAHGRPPDGLTLVDVSDSTAYHFEAAATLDYPDVILASRRAAFGG